MISTLSPLAALKVVFMTTFLAANYDEIVIHYNDVIMRATASQITGVSVAQPFVQAQFKENTNAPRHWPLWGESTGDRWIPLTKGQ